MPVIVIGADTNVGAAIVEALIEPDREVRAFVSDVESAADLKAQGAKVAVGDVTDGSHVESASMRCFTAVLIETAAVDGRERSFASSREAVHNTWARAIESSGITRAIWVSDVDPPATAIAQVARVLPDDPDAVEKVVALDEAQTIENFSSLS